MQLGGIPFKDGDDEECKDDIPICTGTGKDVVVNFDLAEFCTENNTFYTDSNALEMQKR